MKVSVNIHCVASGELPEHGERVIGLSRQSYGGVALLMIPAVFWNSRKKKFEYTHGAAIGSSVDFWFYESELVSSLPSQNENWTRTSRRQVT